MVDGSILDKLCDAAKRLPALLSDKESQMIITGIMFVRKGDIIGSLGSANRTTCLYQVISSNQSIDYTWTPFNHNPFDIMIRCGEKNFGIHAWCMNVVHEPLNGKKLDSRHEFVVEWQGFTLDGQPG